METIDGLWDSDEGWDRGFRSQPSGFPPVLDEPTNWPTKGPLWLPYGSFGAANWLYFAESAAASFVFSV